MKKFITVCIVCFLIILLSYNLSINKNTVKSLISPVVEKIEDYTEEKEIPYTTDFVINDINIKTNDYYYNTLDLNKQAVYKSLANAVKELKTEFEVQDYVFENSNQVMNDVEEAMYKFLLDHPEVFYLNDKYTIATKQSIFGDKVVINVSYLVASKEELEIKLQQIMTSLQEIINNANLGIGTQFEKELRLHDILAQKVRYYEYTNVSEIPANAHTIYGALVENVAVCDGMSKALQILLDKANIESIIVTGSLDNESHAWNMVRLNNKWYNVDITSNKSIKDYKNIVIHSYFNISTSDIKNTHKIENETIIPVANSEECNYFVALNKVITPTDNFNQRLEYIIANNKDAEKVEYKVKNVSQVPEKTIELLQDKGYYQYLDETMTKFVYYNVLDNYIIVKR